MICFKYASLITLITYQRLALWGLSIVRNFPPGPIYLSGSDIPTVIRVYQRAAFDVRLFESIQTIGRFMIFYLV